MTVIVLTKVPSGLRGHLTRWLLEVAPGVYVGRVSSRVRDSLWGIVMSMIGDGRALMIFSARNEQGLEIRNYHHSWTPVDLDGVTLMQRPRADQVADEPKRPFRSRARAFRDIKLPGK